MGLSQSTTRLRKAFTIYLKHDASRRYCDDEYESVHSLVSFEIEATAEIHIRDLYAHNKLNNTYSQYDEGQKADTILNRMQMTSKESLIVHAGVQVEKNFWEFWVMLNSVGSSPRVILGGQDVYQHSFSRDTWKI